MQWLFNNSKAKAELTERDDGTSLTTVPISQRFPLFALLIGIVALPFFCLRSRIRATIHGPLLHLRGWVDFSFSFFFGFRFRSLIYFLPGNTSSKLINVEFVSERCYLNEYGIGTISLKFESSHTTLVLEWVSC